MDASCWRSARHDGGSKCGKRQTCIDPLADRIDQKLMAGVTHAAQIDLRFGDPARESLDFGVGVCPGNFARALPPLRTRPDRNKRAGSIRGEARFAPRERGPARFSGRCCPARLCGWP
jgi:hypothetical protein